jgi:hypothetical protein
MCLTVDGVWILSGFIGHLSTTLGINYGAIANATHYESPQHPLSLFSSLLYHQQQFPSNGF